jgi:hypothetical protein
MAACPGKRPAPGSRCLQPLAQAERLRFLASRFPELLILRAIWLAVLDLSGSFEPTAGHFESARGATASKAMCPWC